MLYRVACRHLVMIVALSFVFEGMEARADLTGKSFNSSVLAVNAYRNKDKRTSTGLIVQSDPYNGYLLTHADLVANTDKLSVTSPKTGLELSAQVIVTDPTLELALIKVNGLNLPPLSFAVDMPLPGDVVWSLVRWAAADQDVGLSRGNLRNAYELPGAASAQMLSHTAGVGSPSTGSVLLNDCGEVIGFNTSLNNAGANGRAVDAPSLRRLLSRQNIKVNSAASACISPITQANEKAELATIAAEQARIDAKEAQRFARSMEAQLQLSNQRNETLVNEAASARTTAEAAIAAAEKAQRHAEQTRVDLEKQTASIIAETQALVTHLQEDGEAAEARFQAALAAQRQSSETREFYLFSGFISLVAFLMVAIFVIQKLGIRPATIMQAVQAKDISVLKPKTVLHKPALEEYVLDGRDEDGIRYLLRISGDQLQGDKGIVIGRNPNESPYIINHSDVSRQHARLKVMKNRVFIEDLGSTNGTSVNGQNIDDKGLVSVSNGDQIIIGSVVMKLKVMGA